MSTKINIKNLPLGYQSVISNGKHAILGDEPVSSKGTDLGFSPVELLLAGISMCKVATIRNVARRKGWEIGEVDAQLEQKAVRQPNGTFKTTVASNIQIQGNITEEQRDLLVQEADNCYVTRLVRGEWEFLESVPLEPVEA
ncbi:OsmC family protein [Arenibacter sp. M-2]|uniref:OsmC family protein n=1 Tax=unclassified Arenibacter TaxID=2615047 RepID=UPI000D760778|nr:MULTISPECIES: OsmC family protein [unclassified Arenibacter]MDL5514265.1 OsmC family protein [Arenibacter sp. M-2]PXX29669.1 putative redox protein [Arenibacter sp. ARW7G5Y1]|tara:strand:- start:13881 stop:14303 length:423 start_codon:yes stop_codon:yes gene_type:complete